MKIVGKVTAFNNISKSDVNESFHAHCIHKGLRCMPRKLEKLIAV